MGELIKADFASRKRIGESDRSSYPSTVELRSVSTTDRSELIGRIAVVTARLELARARGDDLEVQDLAISLQEHTKAVSPELSQREVNSINQGANRVLNELMGIGG